MRYVRAGTLDDPSSVAPDVHIFGRSKLPWVTVGDAAPLVDVYYDQQELWPQASLDRLAAVLSAAG